MGSESCTAFAGKRCVASGSLMEVAKKVKKLLDDEEPDSILIFDDSTSEPVEVDFRGTVKDVLERLEGLKALSFQEKVVPRGPGRPKLGVVCREVSLLPRHWDWLNAQPGGASVALRKLVEEARRVNRNRDRIRRSQEVAYRFMSAMAGNLPGFEEATRALFAGNSDRFESLTDAWPEGIRDHSRRLAEAVFQR
jgi:uncharacterized protein